MRQDFQVHTLDLRFQGIRHAIAAYLVEGPTGRILVETGAGSTLEALLQGLGEKGVSPDEIDALLVTHIHLDHAGAAGWWAQRGVPVYVHLLGARHIVDPSRLIASAGRIYGDRMDSLWGEILPAPEDRVIALRDGDRIEKAGLTLTAWNTPGHARHHHIFQLDDIAFTGDAAGIRRPGLTFAELPAPPPEFDLEAWRSTLDNIQGRRYRRIFPTHFGAIDDVDAHLDAFRELLNRSAEFVANKMEEGFSREELIVAYSEWHSHRAQQAGLRESAILGYRASNPLAMSVDGIMRYWQRRRQRAEIRSTKD